MKQMDLLSQPDTPKKTVTKAPPVAAKKVTKKAVQKAEEKQKEPNIFSVSQVNKQIKGMLEGEFPLLWIQGEISNFKAHSSGHFYFSLKDSKAQINAVMFKGFNSRLKFKPKDGQEVLIRGKVTVYEPRGNYQIFCEVMEPVGAGALQMAFEELKRKLYNEGLFSPEKKRALPALPKKVALVTSPTGAAVKDMLNVLGRRFKGLEILIVPALVQGERAAPSIVEGVQKVNQLKDVDVMIVGRGGGSIEDLWAFNEEIVARAISESKTPVVSAVGHEVDYTIADFVADLRAPTPSAAAELVVKNAGDLSERVRVAKERLFYSFRSLIDAFKGEVESYRKRLVDPQRHLQDLSLRCDELVYRLEQSTMRVLSDYKRRIDLSKSLKNSMKKNLDIKGVELSKQVALLDSLSPLKVVERGYSITKKQGAVIKLSSDLKKGDEVELQFAKGKAKAEIKELEK